MKLGIDVFSLRYQGWDAFQLLDYAQQQGLDLVHFSDLGPFERLDDGYLAEVKADADRRGLELEAGMLSICPTSAIYKSPDGKDAVQQVTEMLHTAQLLGSPVLRCVLGSSKDRVGELPLGVHMQNTIDTCRAVRSLAMELGIKLAIENHAGDMQAWELRELIERAGPEYVGACIDPGNAIWVHEDPLLTLEMLAPYVVTSHVRDSAVWPHARGASVLWVAMGDGNVGIDHWAETYKQLCPDAPFTLEIITGGAPKVLNYFDADYWIPYRNARANEFARFHELVRKGTPYTGTVVVVAPGDEVPDEYAGARVAQQRYDLERSVAYCRQRLGVGE